MKVERGKIAVCRNEGIEEVPICIAFRGNKKSLEGTL